MYAVYDSCGKLVKSGFPNFMQAMNYMMTYGNTGWSVERMCN